VWFHLFSFKLYKVYPISVSNYSKIVEIISDFPKDDCTRSMPEKVDNAPGVDSPQYCAFAHTPSFFPRIKTWFEPAIHSKTSIWAAVNFKPSKRIVTLYYSADILSSQIIIYQDMDVQYQRCFYGEVLLSYFSRYHPRSARDLRTYARTDSHATTICFRSMCYQIF